MLTTENPSWTTSPVITEKLSPNGRTKELRYKIKKNILTRVSMKHGNDRTIR